MYKLLTIMQWPELVVDYTNNEKWQTQVLVTWSVNYDCLALVDKIGKSNNQFIALQMQLMVSTPL